MTADEKAAAKLFYDTVCHKKARCILSGRTARGLRRQGDRLTAHHVVPQQSLRRYGHADKLWDPRNGVPIGWFAHESHTLSTHRIPRRLLPAAAEEFAAEVGLTYLLDRQYGPSPQSLPE